jgi:hypothetical protein
VMMRILVVHVVLICSTMAGASVPAVARAGAAQPQGVVESRVIDVRGDQVLLHDGTRLAVPRYVADPTEIRGGDTVKFTYEVRNGQKVATSIQFIDRPGGGPRRW